MAHSYVFHASLSNECKVNLKADDRFEKVSET